MQRELESLRTMRILITVFSPPTGTLGPHTRTLAIGSEARSAGHEVAYCATAKLAPALAARGFPVYPVPEPTILGLPRGLSALVARRLNAARVPVPAGRSFGNIWMVLLLTGLGKPALMCALLEAELAAARSFSPDVLCTELDPAVYLVSEITGIPLATTYAAVAEHGIGTWAYRRLQRGADRILSGYGRPPKPLSAVCFGPRVLKIIPSIPELDGTDPARPDVRYVGSLLAETALPSGPTDPVPPGRWVFAYLGTGSLSLSSMKRTLPKVFPAGGGYHCVAASEAVKRDFAIGAVRFRSYVPAASLLPHCEWTLCHGGHNTIVQSLLHGVPLLIFPGGIFERRFNAASVERAGAGLVGETPDFTARWIQKRMADHARLSRGASLLRERILSYGGARRAVRELAEFVARRAPRATHGPAGE